MHFVLLALVTLGSRTSVAQEPDADGAKDHPAFSRMAGYYINTFEHQQFSVFEFGLEPAKSVEGEYWSFQYILNDGARKAGPLQIGRNYTNLIRQRGGLLLLEQLDSSGGTAIARLPITGGGNLWLQVRVSNGGDVYDLDIIQEAVMTQEVTFTADSLAAALDATGAVTVHAILFDSGRATIQPGSAQALTVIAEMLRANPNLNLEIQGHTDNVGLPRANLLLSRERAAAVKAYLVETAGIAASRLTTAGLGDTRPIAENSTERGRAQNRRVELLRR
jgi:outer membrane protein OmpA-like peptidoglycan-associated protein